jgi:DNA anti-recombination protein RmuC
VDFSVWISTGISLSGLIVAFLSLNHRLRKDKQQHREQVTKSLQAAVDGLHHKLETNLNDLETKIDVRIDRLEQKRSDDVSRLHTRVNDLEKRTFTTLLDRLSNMEGELKGISNIVRVLQERFMSR